MIAIDMRRMLRWGMIAGGVTTFTAAVGMLEAFEDRLLIYPVLSLGYLLLLWFVPVAGYQSTNVAVLEGMEAPRKGLHNVMAGAVSGLVGGVVLALFAIVINAFDLRDVFVPFSPKLVSLLTYGLGVPEGLPYTVLAPAALGLVGWPDAPAARLGTSAGDSGGGVGGGSSPSGAGVLPDPSSDPVGGGRGPRVHP